LPSQGHGVRVDERAIIEGFIEVCIDIETRATNGCPDSREKGIEVLYNQQRNQ
jgi:hypothetical protein